MINSITTIENKKNNPFGDVTSKNVPSDYWLERQDLKLTIKKRIREGKPVILTPEEARKTHNIELIGLSIASATILTAAGIFFVLKGGPKGLSKSFQKFRENLEKRVQNIKLENSGNEKMIKTYQFLIRKLEFAQQRFEIINNFTTLKDVLFKKMMYEDFGLKHLNIKKITGLGKKMHDKITKMFEVFGRQSVTNSYNNLSGKIKERKLLCAAIEKRITAGNTYDIIKIGKESKTKAEWIAKLGELNKALEETYNEHFSGKALDNRYKRIKNATEVLENKFSEMKSYMTKDIFKTFLTEDAILKEKNALQRDVKSYRRAISYSINDLIRDSDKKILEMTKSVNYDDTEKIKSLSAIRSNYKNLVKDNKIDEKVKFEIIKDLEGLRQNLLSEQRTGRLDENIAKNLLNEIDELKKTLTNFRQGQVEEILDIYRKIASSNEYARIEKAYKGNIKTLDKAIKTETDDFVSKVRDLATGGAPTDILTIVGSFASLGYCLKNSDNATERESILLKYGIPAIAGVMTSVYCNMKLYAGTKSLIIGGLSSLVVNRIGTWASTKLEQYKNKNLSTSSSSALTNQISG